jgi:elongation factor G
MPDDIRTQRLLVEIAIEPTSEAEREKLGPALAKLAAEDPSFRVARDQESGQTILKGTSESYLGGKVDILKQIYAIDAHIGAPQVAFLEQPTRRAEVAYAHKKIRGSSGEFAAVKLVVEPGEGYQFESKIVGDAVPNEYMSGIEKGLESVLSCGVVAGFPVTDVKVALIDAKYHEVDSSPQAFEIASRAAFREALQVAKSVLLEPIMKVEVTTPGEYAKSVIDDLGLRRGDIEHKDIRGNPATINATVPLMNMFGYGSALRVISRGRATFTMQFDRYAQAPPSPGADPPFRPAIGMRA